MLHMLLISFVGENLEIAWCAKDNCVGSRRQVLKLLLEDTMRQARDQATILHSISSSNRWTNGSHQPDACDSPTFVDQEEHQGVGGVPTHRRVRLQSCKTLYNRQVPLRGRLRFQPFVAIGHPSSTASRTSKHGRKCKSRLPQEDA